MTWRASIVLAIVQVLVLCFGIDASLADEDPSRFLHYNLDARVRVLHEILEQSFYLAALDRANSDAGKKETIFLENEKVRFQKLRFRLGAEFQASLDLDDNLKMDVRGMLEQWLDNSYFDPIEEALEVWLKKGFKTKIGIGSANRYRGGNPAMEFYDGLIRERLRLNSLFPRTTSEIERIRDDEVLGDEIHGGRIILTFDDGPSDNMENIVAILGELDVRAHFFLLGKLVTPKNSPTIRRMVGKGHLIGHHSFGHGDLQKSGDQTVREELTRATRVLEAATGEKIAYFRSPYGSRRLTVLAEADVLGLRHVLWNIDSLDWVGRLTDRAVLERVIRLGLLQDGGIVLLHETKDRTVNLLPNVIRCLIREGFDLTTLPESNVLNSGFTPN